MGGGWYPGYQERETEQILQIASDLDALLMNNINKKFVFQASDLLT